METLLPGIAAAQVPTDRLTTTLLSVPDRTGAAVPFVHGNVSSSLFWQPAMLALPEAYGRWPLTCADSAAPTRSRWTPPEGCATTPTTAVTPTTTVARRNAATDR